jgi:hypothetical protein
MPGRISKSVSLARGLALPHRDESRVRECLARDRLNREVDRHTRGRNDRLLKLAGLLAETHQEQSDLSRHDPLPVRHSPSAHPTRATRIPPRTVLPARICLRPRTHHRFSDHRLHRRDRRRGDGLRSRVRRKQAWHRLALARRPEADQTALLGDPTSDVRASGPGRAPVSRRNALADATTTARMPGCVSAKHGYDTKYAMQIAYQGEEFLRTCRCRRVPHRRLPSSLDRRRA